MSVFTKSKKQQTELPKGEASKQAQLSLLKGTAKNQKSENEKKEYRR